MYDGVDLSIRQVAAISFKNLVSRGWGKQGKRGAAEYNRIRRKEAQADAETKVPREVIAEEVKNNSRY